MTADEIIEQLGLCAHPEGGWFAETWRDGTREERGSGTAIYFLLKAGETSAWHRVDAVEVWHWYAGSELELEIATSGAVETLRLGDDLAAGARPQRIVPRGAWQRARSTGEFTLVGCTVSPAFVLEGFEMAPAGWSPGD